MRDSSLPPLRVCLAGFVLGSIFSFAASAVSADEPAARGAAADAAAEMARKLQDPLANTKIFATDNAVGFDTGESGDVSFGFQLQPVYAIDLAAAGVTLIPRATVPILGLEPGTDVPPVGGPTPTGGGSVWGLGDSTLQVFVAPHAESGWKWGIGPQLSFKTRTDSALGGPGWGAGVSAVVVGSITEQISFAGLVANHWSYDGRFSTLTLQPMTMYNFEALPGAYVGYNAVIAADWKASSGNRWTVPVGLAVGRTFDVGGGHGFDVSLGPYYNAVRQRGGARWQLRFGLSWIFP